jgi:phenylacetic acid degradation operon negative regulatory protein
MEKLAEFGEVTVGSFFPAKYPEARLWRKLLGLDDRYRFRRETFSSILWRLKAQGLVVRSGTAKQSVWRLSPRGRAFLAAPAFEKRPDGVRRLVIFDIPEKERAKRDAIRLDLAAAGFRQLQKSVWYGERPLPEDFVTLLDALNLRRHVHIFSVREKGTLA